LPMLERPGVARLARLPIGPQVPNLPHCDGGTDFQEGVHNYSWISLAGVIDLC